MVENDVLAELSTEQKQSVYEQVLAGLKGTKPWLTDKPSVFKIGNREIDLRKKGREQAVQIEKLNRWLKEHISPLSDQIKGNQSEAGFGLFIAMLGELTADGQIELANTVLGSRDVTGALLPDGFVDEFYDINWVIDAVQVAGQAAAVQRLLTSFFTGTA